MRLDKLESWFIFCGCRYFSTHQLYIYGQGFFTRCPLKFSSQNQGGRAQHDFSLAWLEAAWCFSVSGQARHKTRQFKKGFVECVLPYYPSTEFESTFNVYWIGVGASIQNCPSRSFLFERGFRLGANNVWYCVNGIPHRRTPGQCYIHMYAFVSYWHLSP